MTHSSPRIPHLRPAIAGRLPVGLLSILIPLLLVACEQPGEPESAGPRAVVSAEGQPLGSVQLPSSCDPSAQEHLERGLALVHHMTYPEAEAEFTSAQGADPECALAYWGAAMSYIHPLWPDVVPEPKRAAARELLAQAAEASHTSAREQGYVAALAGYYEGDDRGERERLADYLEGWTAVHEAFPDDPEAELFTALATLGAAEVADKSYEKQRAAAATAEAVMERIPDHPGAHHYMIHASDFPPLAEQALDTARRYGEVAPENSHALHMTSHIFTRLGLWPESVTYNTRAAAAAGERDAAGNVHMHNLHALDYLAYAHLQTADDRAAEAVLATMQGYGPPYRDHPVTAYAFAAVPARMALERHDWEAAAQLEPRRPAEVAWDNFPQLEAISHFARALGAAHTGDRDAAQAAITRLIELEEAAGQLNIAYDWGTQVAVQRLAAEAWLAFEGGDREGGLELMQQAAELEGTTEKNPVTPGEVLPAAELYGDMLMAAERYAEAEAQYGKALERSPNRFNSLFGAGQAAEMAEDPEGAGSYYAQLLEICSEATGERSELEHAREFVG